MDKPSDDQITLIGEFKSRLKHDARKLRELKLSIKDSLKKGRYAGNKQSSLVSAKKYYRHYHIAYCMIRGKDYKAIEPKCREDNKPNFCIISEAISEYTHIAASENVSAAA